MAVETADRNTAVEPLLLVDVSIEFYPSSHLAWNRGVNANKIVEVLE